MKNHMMKGLAVLAVLALACPDARALSSAGIGNEDVSARVLGMGGVGVAHAVEPGASFLNPANLGSIEGIQATAGGTFIFPKVSRDASGASEGNRPITLATPNFAFAFPMFGGKMAGGLAVESQYGGDARYSAASFAKYLSTYSSFKMGDISPAVSMKVTDKLSVGAAAHYYRVLDVTTENKLNETAINSALGYPGSYPDADSHFKVDGSKLGFGLGATWQPAEGHAIGVSYRSKATVSLSGDVKLSNLNGPSAAVFGGTQYQTQASFDFPMPATVQAGYAFQPDSRWTVELDAAWYGWSAMKSIATRFAETDATRLAVLSTNSQGTQGPEPMAWRDTINLGVGAEYKMDNGIAARAGYSYQPHVSPDANFHPDSMDFTRHEVAVGFGLQMRPVSIDLSYVAVFNEGRDIVNNVGASSLSSVNGHWGNFSQLAVMSLTTRF